MNIINRLTAILAATVIATISTAAQPKKTVAYQDENVRFTVITDGVIRLEWQDDGKFTDSPYLIASERNYPGAE